MAPCQREKILSLKGSHTYSKWMGMAGQAAGLMLLDTLTTKVFHLCIIIKHLKKKGLYVTSLKTFHVLFLTVCYTE